MSFVTTLPEAMTAAAGTLEGVGSAMAAQNAAAAAPTTGVVPAAADEVSALQATQFAAYGTLYQQISTQANAIHEMFVHTLRASADSYDATEAANSATAGSVAGASLSGIPGAALGADPSYGVAGALSNTGVLTAMQAGTVGSAASEFTGLGKGYITAPPGVVSSLDDFADTFLASRVAPTGALASVSAGMGQAAPVGGLSVPPSWAGETTPTAAAARATLAGTGWAAPAPQSTPVATLPAGIPAVPSGDGGNAGFSGFGRPRYGVKPTVMPRPAVV